MSLLNANNHQLPCCSAPTGLDRGEIARVQAHIILSCACRKRKRVQTSSKPQVEQGNPTDLRYKGGDTRAQVAGNMPGDAHLYPMDVSS